MNYTIKNHTGQGVEILESGKFVPEWQTWEVWYYTLERFNDGKWYTSRRSIDPNPIMVDGVIDTEVAIAIAAREIETDGGIILTDVTQSNFIEVAARKLQAMGLTVRSEIFQSNGAVRFIEC
jgi:hypothetical protein